VARAPSPWPRLYQGTPSGVPTRAQTACGLQPLRYVIQFKSSADGRIEIVRRLLRQSALNRILRDVFFYSRAVLRIVNSHLGKSSLPDRRHESQLFARSKCESAFDALDCTLDGHLPFYRDQDVKVVGHHYEIVKKIPTFVAVVTQDFGKQFCGTM